MQAYESGALQSAPADDSTDTEAALSDCEVPAPSQYLSDLEVAEDLYEGVSESGESYTVDLQAPAACDCADFRSREPDEGCKHIIRAEFATRDRALPAWIGVDAVCAIHDCVQATDGLAVMAEGDLLARLDGLARLGMDAATAAAVSERVLTGRVPTAPRGGS